MKERKRKKEREGESVERNINREKGKEGLWERVKDIGEEKDRERRRELKKQWGREKRC